MAKHSLNSREIYADFLRTICIFFVIIIHTTANYYYSSYGTLDFKILLIISILTSCAVPIFYMLSGTFLICKKNDSYKYFYKKILKLFVQTVIWTIIYLFIFKYVMSQDINLKLSVLKSFFKEQVWHLWYMYPLIGLYVLTPFIVKLYNLLTDKEKKILIFLTLILPSILCALQVKYYDIISIPKFSIFFPELGLFISGRYIYENKEKLNSFKTRIFSITGIIISILSIYLITNMFISANGINESKQFLDANKVINIILIYSVYIFFISMDKFFKKTPSILKKIISMIGKNSGGIYFSHMIFIELMPSITIFGIQFTQNSGCLYNMLLGAVFYFLATSILVIIIKKIPILNKIM